MKKLARKRLYKGLPLVDAPLGKDLEIHVSKSDVSSSRRNDPTQCAAAKSISRMLKTEAEVHLARTYILDREKQQYVRYLTPESVSREITSFDRSHHFEPGSYILKAPSPGQRLGIHRGKSYSSNSGRKKNNPAHITVNVREAARKSK